MEKGDLPSSLFRQSSGSIQFFKTKDNAYVNKSLIATCPFNKAHVMKASRLQYHIVQCKKTYTGTKVPCPYNHCEYFEPEDLVAHLPSCASRTALEVQMHKSEKNREEAMTKSNGFAFSAPILPGERYTDEDWDED